MQKDSALTESRETMLNPIITETKLRVILKRIDGVPVNIRYEPVKSLSQAVRFHNLDEVTAFLTGYYKPTDASLYKPQYIKITYEECNPDDV